MTVNDQAGRGKTTLAARALLSTKSGRENGQDDVLSESPSEPGADRDTLATPGAARATMPGLWDEYEIQECQRCLHVKACRWTVDPLQVEAHRADDLDLGWWCDDCWRQILPEM